MKKIIISFIAFFLFVLHPNGDAEQEKHSYLTR